MTAATKPGQCEGGGLLDCHACDLELMERGATQAASIATWALVCIQGDVLIGVAAFCSCTACRFLRRSHLVESVGLLVGLLVGAPLLGTLRTGVCVSMKRVILLNIDMGCGHTRGWLHPWNQLHARVSGRCCVAFEAFRSCLNVGLCGVNDSLQVLCCLGVSGTAHHAL
jgi:hypothetical protein